MVLEAFGMVIASQSGHRLPALTTEQNKALATTPVDELLALPMLQADQVTDPLNDYQISKRGNSLRIMAEAVRWGRRGGTPDEVGSVGALLMGPVGDFLMDGGVTAAYWYGDLVPN